MNPESLEAGKVFGQLHGFKVCTGGRYLGGYIGDDDSKQDWLKECMLTWEKNIGTISKTAGKYTHESYAMMERTIQSEWIFMQCVSWDMGNAFAGVEDKLWKTFLTILGMTIPNRIG